MNAKDDWKTFLNFAGQVVIAHMLTYFVFGMIASNVFHYGEIFALPVIRDYMLPIAQHNLPIGPFLQTVRGLIFAVGLWPIRRPLLESKRGWLILWGLLVTVGILSTPAAAPSSIEGMLYTKLPLWYHFMGLPEILLQTLTFSVWLVWWQRQSIRERSAVAKPENPLAADIVKAIMAACFAYIGYAVGGLLLAALANANAAASGGQAIDIQAAGANLKMQLMFVPAFLVNVAASFWMARPWRSGRLSLWAMFGIFWLLDAFVPWLYQTIFLGGSFIPTALVLGFFPAVIIAISIWASYRKPATRKEAGI